MFQEQVCARNERTDVVKKHLHIFQQNFTSVEINTPDDILAQIGASAQIPKIPKVQY
jgi:hypothetical protein